MKITTANQLTGRAIGSLFFAGFGALWLTLALYVKQILTADRVIAVAAGLATLLLAAFWLMRQARRFPKVAEDPACSRAFNRINGIQWIAIAAVAFSFAHLHIDAYAMSAITAIVGIHLFPLAKLFRYPLHNVTGAALVLWASASVLLVSTEHLQGATALGTGIILWLSAAVTLSLAAANLRRSSSAPAANPDSLCA
ncbi:MAG TPA: hypothetical protein VHZ52_00835 [Acidobacteriaceae bacterium]|jgi:uncharacterized membrane protein YccF (DUF307 family)|nr:hypothetical protein [Acidobacteriaceae bacterium]